MYFPDSGRTNGNSNVQNTIKKKGCQPQQADRAVWEQVTKGRAGVRWDSVLEKAWKGVGGHQEETLSAAHKEV